MKVKGLLFLFFTIVIIVLSVNIIALFNGIHGSQYGKYLNAFNIVVSMVQFGLYRIINVSSKGK